MTPYYQDNLVTLYCGDARRLLPQLQGTDVCITDPVWPDARTEGPRVLAGAVDPAGLFAAVVGGLPRLRMLVTILGCRSDPRFLAGIPAALPFLRVCKLRHALASYAGPVLMDGDYAYVYGAARLPSGRRVLPGEFVNAVSRQREGWTTSHPCPRSFAHVDGLVAWYAAADEVLLDPFAGSGTLVEAAVRRGRRVVAVEINEDYCREIVGRVRWARSQVLLPFEEAASA